MFDAAGCLCLRLQLKVKVLWVKVVNPYVSVLSSAAVAAQTRHKKRLVTVSTGAFGGSCLLPLAIRVECNTVDRTKMPFDPSKLLLIGSVEEPESQQDMF